MDLQTARRQIEIPGFRTVPKTGVIYVTHRAQECGYQGGDPAWANLGQGAPETGMLPGGPPRKESIKLDAQKNEYGPVEGLRPLREKVAGYYNRMFRKGKTSQYTYENVCISSGGRTALTRIAASLGEINMGHLIPDYTAYEELLGIFKAFVPIPILLEEQSGYKVINGNLRKEILGRGLRAMLLSNPCNPTGQLIEGDALREIIEMAREYACTFIFDEFYSHYIYTDGYPDWGKTISAAEFIEDVDQDPIVIIDGLTKNWRYPGWRISWTVAPKEVVHALASAGSFLDGGPNHPFQCEAIALLDVESSMQEARAIQAVFMQKRAFVLSRLKKMGIIVDAEPQGTFYAWANLSGLKESLQDGLEFFEQGLREKVITVPGAFFDVNPGKRRVYARYQNYVRISFGPEMSVLERGLDALERVIAKFS